MAGHTRMLKAGNGVRIGHTATTERTTGKWRWIESLSTYPARGPHGQGLHGVTADGPEGTAVLYLTHAASLELVKGFLMLHLDHPINMTVDDEFRNILQQVLTAVQQQEDEASKIVKAVKRQLPPTGPNSVTASH